MDYCPVASVPSVCLTVLWVCSQAHQKKFSSRRSRRRNCWAQMNDVVLKLEGNESALARRLSLLSPRSPAILHGTKPAQSSARISVSSSELEKPSRMPVISSQLNHFFFTSIHVETRQMQFVSFSTGNVSRHNSVAYHWAVT